jgi:hypothetical protein
MSMQNMIYEMLKIPISKLRIYFSKLRHDSLENVLYFALNRLEEDQKNTIICLEKYSEIEEMRKELILKKATTKDLIKGNKILQIEFEELDIKEKALDAQIQAHKEKLKAKGDPFADLL